MKTPNMIRLLEMSIHAFALAVVWRSASAMMTGGVSTESLGIIQSIEPFAIPVAILAIIGSVAASQLGLRRWRKASGGSHRESVELVHETPRLDQQHEKIIKDLRKKLTELDQENSRLNLVLQEKNACLLQDTLTGIGNRLAYEERLQQEFRRWNRFGNPLTMLIWDIDHFKQINDQYGHAMGDVVLRGIAKLLARRIRSTDFVARFGGEEFVMLLPGADAEAALQLADQIRLDIAESRFENTDINLPVTISCGLTRFQAGDSPQSAFARADRALYQSKQAGRNCCTTC